MDAGQWPGKDRDSPTAVSMPALKLCSSTLSKPAWAHRQAVGVISPMLTSVLTDKAAHSLPFPVYHNEFSCSLLVLSCSDYMNNALGASGRFHDSTQMTSVFVSVHQGRFRLGSTALECSEQGTIRHTCSSEGYCEASAPNEHGLQELLSGLNK